MVVATGFFDGVHLGHRITIGRLLEVARLRNTPSMVLTFWPHPRNVLQKDASSLRLLTSLEEKKSLLKAMGVDRVEVIEFTREFASLTAAQYIEMLKERYGAEALVLGYDNRFGSDGLSTEEVATVARAAGLDVQLCEPLQAYMDGEVAISSTLIRRLLSEGMVGIASGLLGGPYSLFGVVVQGNRLGRTIGFPTANMQLYNPLKMVPANGVYLVQVEALGRQLYGMCNIGTRPTVGGSARTIETNIFDFDEDIYGLDIRISFLAKMREERKFEGMQQLQEQLFKDRETCLETIQNYEREKRRPE